MEKRDKADFYQEESIRGRAFIAIGLVAQGILFFMCRLMPEGPNFSSIINLAILLSMIPISLLYIWGFYLAVRDKGYPPLFTLLAFASWIGVIILFYMPKQNTERTEAD
ncbi:MAG: hypothetical protein ACLFUS_14755 [Candidatus Sumerlaeia bacterium]